MNEIVKMLTNCMLLPGVEVDIEVLKTYLLKDHITGNMVQLFKALRHKNQ